MRWVLLNIPGTVDYRLHGGGFIGPIDEEGYGVRSVINGARNVEEYPAQLIAPTEGELHWFLDEAAAAKLPK